MTSGIRPRPPGVEEAEPAILAFVQAVVRADVPPDAADFLSSAILWPFHKDDPVIVAADRARAAGTSFTPRHAQSRFCPPLFARPVPPS